jgi:hypothetical protein
MKHSMNPTEKHCVKLTKPEASLLSSLLTPSDPLGQTLQSHAKDDDQHGKIDVVVASAQIPHLLNVLADALSMRGIGHDLEPNAVGKEIENLIDKFNGLLYG